MNCLSDTSLAIRPLCSVFYLFDMWKLDSLVAQMVKRLPTVWDPGLIPETGKSPEEGKGNPLQYSYPENSMDGGAWLAPVHGVTKSWTRLSDFTLLVVDTVRFVFSTPLKVVWGCRKAERSYSTVKVRRGGPDEISFIQGKDQWLHFAGAAVNRYPTSKVRETQVRW